MNDLRLWEVCAVHSYIKHAVFCYLFQCITSKMHWYNLERKKEILKMYWTFKYSVCATAVLVKSAPSRCRRLSGRISSHAGADVSAVLGASEEEKKASSAHTDVWGTRKCFAPWSFLSECKSMCARRMSIGYRTQLHVSVFSYLSHESARSDTTSGMWPL